MNQPLAPDDTRDAMRQIGGLLIGLAAAMIYIRKGPFLAGNPEQWAAFPMLLVLAIPAVYLYGAILTRPGSGGLRPWQAVHSVFGLVFVALALRQLVDLLGGSPSADLNTFWIFGATAGFAFYAGFVAGVRVQILAGAILVIVSWSALWDKLLGGEGIGGHWGVYRGLLGLLSIGLLAAALYVWRTNPGGEERADTATEPAGDIALWKASEILTGAGIAAVLACSLGITALGNLNPLGTSTPPIQTSTFWDIMLLLVSLGLVGIGSQIGTRGPVYVGGIGLALFLLIAGLDLNSAQPNPLNFGGWPWVLLILGLLAIGLSYTREASLGDQPRRFVKNLRGR
jgi:NADH:ubiquinone oxidoreductase subunit 6 (subunit J)